MTTGFPSAVEIGRAAHGALGQIDVFYGANGGAASQTVRGESLIVEGWAAAADSMMPPRSVAVLVGDEHVWTVQPTVSRPDVGASLGTSETLYGFVAVIDTTALPLGTHTVRIASQNDAGTWQRSQQTRTIRIVQGGAHLPDDALPSQNVFVDLPLLADAQRETLTVSIEDNVWIRGWALDERARPGRSVSIVIDGVVAGDAAYGFSRPDVVSVRAFPSDSNRCGFRYHLAVGTLSIGTHIVHALLRDANGTIHRSAEPIRLCVVDVDPVVRFFEAPPLPAAWIDEVRSVHPDGRTVSRGNGLSVRAGDTLIVTGWALDHDNRDAPARVVVVVDGESHFDAGSGLYREDIRARFGYGTRAGFHFSITTGGLAERDYLLQIYIVKNDNRSVESTGATVQFAVGNPSDVREN